jgi:hypothetical protein
MYDSKLSLCTQNIIERIVATAHFCDEQVLILARLFVLPVPITGPPPEKRA